MNSVTSWIQVKAHLSWVRLVIVVVKVFTAAGKRPDKQASQLTETTLGVLSPRRSSRCGGWPAVMWTRPDTAVSILSQATLRHGHRCFLHTLTPGCLTSGQLSTARLYNSPPFLLVWRFDKTGAHNPNAQNLASKKNLDTPCLANNWTTQILLCDNKCSPKTYSIKPIISLSNIRVNTQSLTLKDEGSVQLKQVSLFNVLCRDLKWSKHLRHQ